MSVLYRGRTGLKVKNYCHVCIYIYIYTHTHTHTHTIYSLYDIVHEESAISISKGISEEVLWAEQCWQEQEIISFPKYPDDLCSLPSSVFSG